MSRPIPQHLEPLIASAIRMAKTKLEAGEEVPGIAFIDAPEAPEAHETRMIAIPMTQVPDKDAWSRMVRTISAFVEARFVMVVTECWIAAVGPHDKTAMDRMDRDGVKNEPGRREAVFVSVETHDGLWSGFAYLHALVPAARSAAAVQDPKTFGEIKLEMPKRNEGRIVGLLGTRRGRQN